MAISRPKASVTLISLGKNTYYNVVTLPSLGFIDFPLISFSLQITAEEAVQSLFIFCVVFVVSLIHWHQPLCLGG